MNWYVPDISQYRLIVLVCVDMNQYELVWLGMYWYESNELNVQNVVFALNIMVFRYF